MFAWENIKRFLRLVSTSTIDPAEQYRRLKLMERDIGVPVKIARIVLDEMETALSRGLGDRDASIVMTLQEERADVHISSRSNTS